jgi:hypothetical protein
VSECPLLLGNGGHPDGSSLLISVWCQGALSCSAIEGALAALVVTVNLSLGVRMPSLALQ